MRPMLLAALALTAAPSGAQAPAPAPTPPPPLGQPLTLAQAHAVLEAALAEAARQKLNVAVAVVEPSGALVAFERRDGTQYASLDVAQDKARSAALFRQPTLAFAQAIANGRVGVLSLRGAVAVEGGVPLLQGGKLVGAVGVSGATSAQDGAIARAGAAALR